MISTPDKPTRVFIGDNASLTWHYYHPAHITVFEVAFGIWKWPGYLKTKLVAVSGTTGIPDVRPGYESSVGWAGNLTASRAVFILYNVQPANDNTQFGIHIEFDPFAHNPLTDTVRLKVEAKRR